MNELDIKRTPETVGAEIRGLTAQAKQMTLWFGIEIGRRLCEVKEMIGHGEWLPYQSGAKQNRDRCAEQQSRRGRRNDDLGRC